MQIYGWNYFIVGMICISLIISPVEHFHMLIFHLCIFFFGKLNVISFVLLHISGFTFFLQLKYLPIVSIHFWWQKKQKKEIRGTMIFFFTVGFLKDWSEIFSRVIFRENCILFLKSTQWLSLTSPGSAWISYQQNKKNLFKWISKFTK